MQSNFPSADDILDSPSPLSRPSAAGKETALKLRRIPLFFIIPGLVLKWVGDKFFTPVRSDVYLAGAMVGLFLVLCYTAFAFAAIKGRSSSHKELATIFVLALLGFLVFMIPFMTVTNGLLDRSPPAEHIVQKDQGEGILLLPAFLPRTDAPGN